MTKKTVQFTIEVEVEIQEEIQRNYAKMKPELITIEKAHDQRLQNLLQALLKEDRLAWSHVVEKAYFQLDDLMSFDTADELEENSQECLEEAIEDLEELDDQIYFQECVEHKNLAKISKPIYDNFIPTIKSVKMKEVKS